MGDDLGDEWWQHEGNSDVSEKEEEEKDEEQKQSTEIPQKKSTKKRKSVTENPDDVGKKKKLKKAQPKESVVAPEKNEDESTKKPRKRKRKKKTITDVLASSEPKPGSPADLQNLVVNYFSDKRSVIEQEELALPDSSFLTSNDLSHTLSSYLKEICPKWAKVQKQHTEKSSVVLLIVCSSALRTIELIKQLTTFKGDARALKLFAKHIKVEEQVKLLQKAVTHIGVGTPARICSLIDREGLNLQTLRYLVLDWNWRDQKLRRMVDVAEVKVDLLKLLDTGGLVSRCKGGQVKIGLF